jgi:hypothetical protein
MEEREEANVKKNIFVVLIFFEKEEALEKKQKINRAVYP